jgi:Sec-independent protein translocase protein TatA
MFDFGFGEMIGLVVLALILVGPERMPRVAADLAKMIRKVRSLTNSATAEIRENLGRISHSGTKQFKLAKEQNSDLIGQFGSFEGEEIRTASITLTTCTNGCKANDQLGRLLTTTFMPSDYVANACGTQICEAWQIAAGNTAASFECVYYGADYGGRNDLYNVRGHPECGYATTVEMSVNCLNCAGQFALTPATPKRASVGTATSTAQTAGGAAAWGSARNVTVGFYGPLSLSEGSDPRWIEAAEQAYRSDEAAQRQKQAIELEGGDDFAEEFGDEEGPF